MYSLRKVLVIHPEGNIFNNPTLKCIVDLLKEKGVDINIRYRRTSAPMPTSETTSLFPYNRSHFRIRRFLFEILSLKCLVNLYVRLISRKYSDGVDLVIGVDREGVIEAAAISRIMEIPFVFFSFEIMFENETGTRFKEIERSSVRQLKYWFVQDKIRRQCLVEENHLSEDNCITLPLASAGIGKFHSNRLRDDIGGLSVDKKVAILFGSIADWAMTNEIIKSVNEWPKNWVLILHNRYGDTQKELRNFNFDLSFLSNKIFISNHGTDMVDDMGYILNGVSAGICFYKPNFKDQFSGKNLKYIGLSSGKISTCLRYSIPVITNDIGLYSKLASEKKFGFVVANPSEIGNALKNLEINENQYRSNALDFFSNTLDFNNYRNMVWDKLSYS